ncbi:HNH endonuclease [Tumebacillus sp. ITR2]|uniref:HNH endonuclease n=1 Tax=Tumebacillus amylolyticus TaxID=2801339 RepID=A0ABS1J5R2_9BACL|nr:HNH endonuclease [Tumebacillus amylolyticus]MBL0385621.1 HNH endonuclease [Tumebacillus amylolyticus]
MSKTKIPEKIKIRLWVMAAGRCQYEGCNQTLYTDTITKKDFNIAYIAHIVADRPEGPRGDEVLSDKLKSDISNLMLMCDTHHRLIDQEDEEGHPVEKLQEMKRKHEQRIQMLTSIKEDRQSHVLLYGANIGQHFAPVSWERAKEAMLPEFYPAEKTAIELGLRNSSFQDEEDFFWEMERQNLRRHFLDKVKRRMESGELSKLSVFALAPQPLLVELGTLLSDIPAADVYQLHREPANWCWQPHPEPFSYTVIEPTAISRKIALNLSISATIDNSRIAKVVGEETSIWTMTVETPNNDFLRSKQQLSLFRQEFRLLMDRIKAVHGEDSELHVFPAVPVAIAVEIGRVWMPKADLPLIVYDQNRSKGGFTQTLVISSEKKHLIAGFVS